MTIPFEYLGILNKVNPRKEEMWRPIIEKFQKRLAVWKHRHLFVARRVCLINFFLSSLPLFFFKVLQWVISKLICLQRNFLWVSWRKVCHPRSHGGLRIRDISICNEALLGKWMWGLCGEGDYIWRDVLISKYGNCRNLVESSSNRVTFIWWRDIKKVCGGGSLTK